MTFYYARIVLVLFSLSVTGCATYSNTLPKDAAPAPDKAYLFGNFTEDGPGEIGLAIAGKADAEKYVFEFLEEERLSVIEVDPGRYRMGYMVISNFFGDVTARQRLLGKPFGEYFVVEAGNAYYLGEFEARFRYRAGAAAWDFPAVKNTFSDSTQVLEEAYPAFSPWPKVDAFR